MVVSYFTPPTPPRLLHPPHPGYCTHPTPVTAPARHSIDIHTTEVEKRVPLLSYQENTAREDVEKFISVSRCFCSHYCFPFPVFS